APTPFGRSRAIRWFSRFTPPRRSTTIWLWPTSAGCRGASSTEGWGSRAGIFRQADRGCCVHNQDMPCVLAVDRGNNQTIAVVAALDGSLLGTALGGCADIYNAVPGDGALDSASAALANVEQTVWAALDEAQLQPSDIALGVFNLAGVDWPEDVAFWREAL